MQERLIETIKKEKPNTQHFGAHAGIRSGLSDYHDGGSYSHYGGNDDLYPEEIEMTELYNGKMANGNDNESDDSDQHDHGKIHSGL